MKPTAKKTERADEHTEQSGDAVIEGKAGISETPEEQTATFQAISADGDDSRPAEAAGSTGTPVPGEGSTPEPSTGEGAPAAPTIATAGELELASTSEPEPAMPGEPEPAGAVKSDSEPEPAMPGEPEPVGAVKSEQAATAWPEPADPGTPERVESVEPRFNAFAPVTPVKPRVTGGSFGSPGALGAEVRLAPSGKGEEPVNVSSSEPQNLFSPHKAPGPDEQDGKPLSGGSSAGEDASDEFRHLWPDLSDTPAAPRPDPSTSLDVRTAAEDGSATSRDVPGGPEDVFSASADVSSTPEEDAPAGSADVSTTPKDISSSIWDVSLSPQDISAGIWDVHSKAESEAEDVPASNEDTSSIVEDVFTSSGDAPVVSEDVPSLFRDAPVVSGGVPSLFTDFRSAREGVPAYPEGVPETTEDVSSKARAAEAQEDFDGEGALFRPQEPVREVPLPKPVSRALALALSGLRDSVTGLRLGLEVPGVEEARKAQGEILTQIEDYVIPRVHMSTAPALVVVVGSTGAGKSTLVNTLAAAKVSATGVRRPTTGTPVLACHPDDREWFAKGDVLGGMIRIDRPGSGVGLDRLVLTSTERLPQGVALLDTPDIDSVVETHHEVAHRMLDAADLWVFVTTATRYADAPSWKLLRLAKERGARLAIVLSRVPVRSREVIDKHFHRMLQEYGLGDVERFVVNEATVTAGRLPEEEVAELRMWLTELSVDDQRRSQAVQATLDGVLNSFRSRVPALARHLEAQVAFRGELRTDVDAAYMGALAEVDRVTSDGSLLRGEVLARWQDFAGSGDLMKTLHLRRPGRFATKTTQQAPLRLRAFKAALRSGLESVVVSAGQRAAEEVVARWRQREGVGDRLAASPGLGRPSDEFVRRVGRTIGAWQEHVVGLIHSGGVAKRSVAKIVAFDDESLSLIFMVGLLGYGSSDVATASGTGTLPERLLRGVLGADSLRGIGTRARSDLRARISVLFDEETLRYVQVLDEAGIPDEAAAKRLYQATYNLEVAR